MQYVESRKIISFLDYWGIRASINQISSFYTNSETKITVLLSCLFYWTRDKIQVVICNPFCLVGQICFQVQDDTWHIICLLWMLFCIMNSIMRWFLHLYNIYHLSLHFILCLHVSLIVSAFPVFVPFTYTSSSYQVELVFMCIVLD